ncbi:MULTISPECIES: hypothetical protein [unclassified Streptomyces]|uniref:hypothetical protein n=1 Tax=unclassified Streptomyces TaxID=2593676 RepID=UPI0033BBF74F
MTTATFTPARSLPGSRTRPLTTALRAIRAYGGAAVGVVLLGDHPREAGVRNPRPVYRGGAD